ASSGAPVGAVGAAGPVAAVAAGAAVAPVVGADVVVAREPEPPQPASMHPASSPSSVLRRTPRCYAGGAPAGNHSGGRARAPRRAAARARRGSAPGRTGTPPRG